jgi:hypothetical protein
LFYGSAPGRLLIADNSFTYHKEEVEFLVNFAAGLADMNVFINCTFKSLEAVYGGAVYLMTNVCVFLLMKMDILFVKKIFYLIKLASFIIIFVY